MNADRGGVEEEKRDKKLHCTDPCIVITTTSLAGIICLGVLIVELDIRRSSSTATRAEMPIVNSRLYGCFKRIRVDDIDPRPSAEYAAKSSPTLQILHNLTRARERPRKYLSLAGHKPQQDFKGFGPGRSVKKYSVITSKCSQS